MRNRVTILLIALFTGYIAIGQTVDIVKSDSITFPIHKKNVGKITFMERPISIENYNETDFLNTFVMKENADLNIRVFLGNSLTNYLHQLSPKYSIEELTKNGNYHFTFFVDNKIIYSENLNPGAGSAESKNQRTVFRVPLLSSTNEDSWGRFLWNRFLMNGGEDAFTTGEHLLKIEIRPYLKIDELKIGNILAEGQIKIVVPEIKIDEQLIKFQTILPLNDWKISADTFDNSLIEELNRKIVGKTFKDITSIVVIKEGKLLIEEYFNGAKRDSLHDTRSVGKSFASAILGIAIHDGHLKSEMQTLKEFYDLTKNKNYSTKKGDITLKSLLTMSSSFDGSDMNQDSPGNEENMYPTNNWVNFTLDLPIDTMKSITPHWDYFTAGVVVLGDIVHRSAPLGLEKYADKNLFLPLGITNYKWQYTPQNVANTAGGLQLRSIDYAKFGQLYKNIGSWNGKQILTKDWVSKSLSKQMQISDDEFYGYLFWNKTFKVDSTNYEVYYSSGNGGNKIYIFKDQPLVLVITSTAYNTPYGHKQVDKIMQNYLIPALAK